MADGKGRLTVAVIAEEFGIAPSDWRARVSRGHAPRPDGYDRVDGTLCAVYRPETIARYRQQRAARMGGVTPTGGNPVDGDHA